ncbi:hypothetical protein HDE69_005371 [Pedobacter cryoconitis]|uniref:Uncharacterized protein n=1 Tax=Pedobacter cryoconitis TaxID=188932 RepID=A0A7W8YZ01_9SPHI|nr:hypothetical protein [Pedobacter cryoconitis]MBB5624272.1 hypothetical protein [Pedobacter cryoconitis]
MAAPNTVYLDGGATRVPIHIEGEIKLDAYPALKLVEYGSSIKELFFLDAWLMVEDGQGKSGFIGLVKEDSYDDHKMQHAKSRWFKARLEVDGQRYIMLNDAGLNTLAYYGGPSIGEIDRTGTNGQDYFAGQVFLSVFYRSAYYAATIDYGFYASVNGKAFVKYSMGTLAQRQELYYEASTPIPDLKFGDSFKVDVYILNEEGERRYGAGSFTSNAGVKITGWRATHASWACAKTNDAVLTTVYVKQLPIFSGDFVYTNKTCEMGDELRFSVGIAWDGEWIKTKGDGTVEYVGICGGSYPPDDPAMINWVAGTYKMFDTDLESGCLYAGTGRPSPITLYRNINNDKYYTSAAAAREGKDYNYAMDGYYWTFLGPKSSYHVITSGLLVDSGICND